jgi:hypothetical protein
VQTKFSGRKVVWLMVSSIRSGSGAPSNSPARRRAPRGAEAVVLRAVAGCAALVAWLFFAIPAQAEEIEPEEEFSEPSWIPSIEIGFETFDYKTDTEVASDLSTLEPIFWDYASVPKDKLIEYGPQWTGSQSNARRQLMFRIGGELMGPMFEDLPGRPRLFAQGGALLRTSTSDRIFRIGKPFEIKQPESGVRQYENAGPRALSVPLQFEGQGSQINAQFQDPSWYAGLGVAFSVPIATNLLLHIKPSVQYSMEKIDLSGGLTAVDEPDQSLGPDPSNETRNCSGSYDPTPLPCVREFVIRKSRATASTTDHSIGAGLELELVLFKSARPVRVSLYAGARFMWLLGDDTKRFADGPPYLGCDVEAHRKPDDPPDFVCFEDLDGPIANYSVVRDDFGIRGGGGLRFSWVGFD